MGNDELAEHLDAIQRDECYRVDSILKESSYEVTQKVFFVGSNGAEQGPYIRKYFDTEVGIGKAYRNILSAQKAGRRFRHLPRILDCYTMGEKSAVVMEYVPGETLQDVVYRCDPSLELTNDIFPQLCDAVLELHRGFGIPIIHRDLKPSNVIITQDSLTIIDFGIARTYRQEAEEDTHRFGTRSYAPPEQFGFGQTDERSDVYALGALLYFCLGEKTLDYKVIERGFTDLSVPEGLRVILRKATEFNPRDRYQDVAELKEAFLKTLGSTEGSILPPPIGAPVSTTVKPIKNAKSFLSRIPLPLGIAWDICLALFFALVIAVSVSLTFNPSSSSDNLINAPLWFRALSYFCVAFFVVGPVVYLISDRRPLKRLIPPLRKATFISDVVACLLVFLLGFIIIGFGGQAFLT